MEQIGGGFKAWRLLRHELQEHLLAAAVQEGVGIEFGHRCTGVSSHGGTASLRFDNGTEYECDVILACDGIHSQTRESIGLSAKPLVAADLGTPPSNLHGRATVMHS